MAKHELWELKQMQSMPLEIKIRMTQRRIKAWYDNYDGEVYVSFSGGKDSTVLLHIARELYPNIPAVFCDTGLEYPEVRNFVKRFDDVVWLKPKMSFKEVIETYGYPFISKEISQKVYENRQKPDGYTVKYFTPESEGGKKAPYNLAKYKFLLDAPFKISHMCCNVMKKKPVKQYEKETGRVGITGEMATESRLRLSNWLRYGCNAFESKTPKSKPMSFWTEQDILSYIKEKKIKIASVYGDVVYMNEDGTEYDEVMAKELFQLKTTGLERTGCMFCGFGCHLEKGKGRFERMKETHPKQYEFIMKSPDEGGLGYKDVIDWINLHGGKNIKY